MKKRRSKPILKVIADWAHGNRPVEAKLELYQILKDELDNNSWWYLHGELERLVGYDKGWAINCKKLGISDWSEEYHEFQMCYTGKMLVQVDGISERCVGFFWTTDDRCNGWKQRGLICLCSDHEAIEFAEKRYNEESGNL